MDTPPCVTRSMCDPQERVPCNLLGRGSAASRSQLALHGYSFLSFVFLSKTTHRNKLALRTFIFCRTLVQPEWNWGPGAGGWLVKTTNGFNFY